MLLMERKQNTPKKYPNKGTGQGKNPRKICPECGKYMIKLRYEATIDGKSTTLKPCWICKCEHVEINKEELERIPD